MSRVRQHPVVCGSIAAILTAAVLLVHFHTKYGLNVPPSATGDEPSYDSIGWELSQGNGFAEDFSNPDFRRPYDQAADTQPELMTLPDQLPGTVTYRPPLFPTIVAATNLVFERQYFGTRIWNVVMMAATAGILVWFLLQNSTVVAAGIGLLLFLVLDTRVRLYSRAILTEATAVLLTTLLTVSLLRILRTRHPRDLVIAGIITAAAVLNRTATVLWIPILTVGLSVLLRPPRWLRPRAPLMSGENAVDGSLRATPPSRQVSVGRCALLVACWLVSTCLVCLPWAVRNMYALQAPMPLGAQGLIELPAGFSDQAWENKGVWAPVERPAAPAYSRESATRLQIERREAQRGRSVAAAWMLRHPFRTVALGCLKVWNEYRPRNVPGWLITTAAVLGAATTWQTRATQVFLLLHLANAVAIAVTWSVEGRFVVPLLFTVHVWSATGCVWLWKTVTKAQQNNGGN